VEVADQIVGSGFSSIELRNKASLDCYLLVSTSSSLVL